MPSLLDAYGRWICEMHLYVAFHPHRIYDMGCMFVVLSFFLTDARGFGHLVYTIASPTFYFGSLYATMVEAAVSRLAVVIFVRAMHVTSLLVGAVILIARAILAVPWITFHLAHLSALIAVDLACFSAHAILDSSVLVLIRLALKPVDWATFALVFFTTQSVKSQRYLATTSLKWAQLIEASHCACGMALGLRGTGSSAETLEMIRRILAGRKSLRTAPIQSWADMVEADEAASARRTPLFSTLEDESHWFYPRTAMAFARIVHVTSAFAAVRTFAFTARLAMNAEALMLNSATSLATTLQSARIQLQSAAICRSARLAHAWELTHVIDSAIIEIYVLIARRYAGPLLKLLIVLIAFPFVQAGGEDSKKVPMFSGDRSDFTNWFMIFTAYVAYKLVAAAPLAAGTRPRPPDPPLPLTGRADPEPPRAPAPIADPNDASVIVNQTLIDAANQRRLAWLDTPVIVRNQSVIDAATAAIEKWETSNTQLYGLLIQAMPTWLVTSLYNTHQNDGVAAIKYLRGAFDANHDDGGDHATHLSRLQTRLIDARADISESDLRRQYDMMMSESAAIRRTGHAAPDEPTMIAFYDSSLPIAYATMRQHARRSRHATLLAHHSDIMSQVRAETSARAPAPNAFVAVGPTPGGPGPSPGGPAAGGGDGGKAPFPDADKTCLRCGKRGHARSKCKQTTKAACKYCGSDHQSEFCSRGGNRYRSLADVLRRIVDSDVGRSGGRNPPVSYAAAANSAAAGAQQRNPSRPPLPALQHRAPSPPWRSPSPPLDTPSYPPLSTGPSPAQHAAAMQAASVHSDAQTAVHAYAAALRGLGFGMPAFLDLGAYADLASTMPLPPAPVAPALAQRHHAFVDTMATFCFVPSKDMLYRITDPSPRMEINTANGKVPVSAIGTALMYLHIGGTWECYEVPNVYVLDGCDVVLYSTRVMHDCFNFKHLVEDGRILVPGAPDIPVHDTGTAYVIPVAFVPPHAPRPAHVYRPARTIAAAFLTEGQAFPVGVAGTQQAVLHQRLGFPYPEQWIRVPAATTDHGLPPNTAVTPNLPVRDVITRGRARAAPFLRKPPAEVRQPPPAAVIYMDFAGPLLPSIFHRYTCYVCCVDAGSAYGRLYPAHNMTAAVATAALEVYTAELASLMGFHGGFKPLVVRSDQGSAFVSYYFREFLAARQIHQSLACTYTPQQNAHAERFFGIIFATARVLLASANLPPSFHPFAIQTAVWIHNRLPRPSRGDTSPFTILTHTLPSLLHLYCFGCLAAVVVPTARREGDRHFADRGEHAIYLGPSEVSPGHVVYLLSSRRVTTVAKCKPWEDQFPGLAGERFIWFSDFDADVPQLAATSSPEGLPASHVPPLTAGSSPEGLPASPAPNITAHFDGSRPPPATHPPPSPPRAAPSPSLLPTPRTARHTTDGTARNLNLGGDAPVSAGRAPPRGATAPPENIIPGFGATEAPVSAPSLSRNEASSLRDHNLGDYWKTTAPRRAGSRSSSEVRYAQAAMQLALNTFALIAVAHASLHVDVLPGFAYISSISSVDEAFDGTPLDTRPDAWLVQAAALAASADTLTITADMGELQVPKSFRQAMRSPQQEYWRAAIAKELGGLLALQTWEMVPANSMPAGSNLMHCHYVFAVKRRADGSIEKFKARLVADGNTQKQGVDFDRVFASVVKTSTIRLVLVIAAARDFNLSSIDIRQAYLQGHLSQDLYMRPPPDVYPFDNQGRPLVCKLLRSLYGLKQAGREWAILFSSFLTSWGMTRSTIDPCLYTYRDGRDGDAKILWVLVYVDDALIADNDAALRDRFVKDLSARFPTEDKGDLAWILSVAITRDRAVRTLTMSQELYVTDLVTKFGSFLDPSLTRQFDCPMEEGLVLSAADQPEIGSDAYTAMAANRDVYMSLVGGFLWLANMTMFHLAYPAGQLSRFLTNPGQPHFLAALRVLAYLRSAGARPLVFSTNGTRGLDTYVDSSWSTRFSVSGCLIFFHGCLFHWFSKMQKSVSLSTAEAEYFGAMMAARDLIFIRDVLVELCIDLSGPSVIWSDSKSAIDMSRDPVAFKMTKHILRAAEFLRDLVAREVVVMQHLPGRVMIADLLTKAVARALYHELLRLFDMYAATGIVHPS
jgi:transposase InsO family protein